VGSINIGDLSREDQVFLIIMDHIASQASAAKFAFTDERAVAFQVMEDTAARMCAAILTQKRDLS